MPRYDYKHNTPNGCDDFETFAHMDDEPLTECPTCGKPVYRAITACNFAFKASAFNESKHFQEAYSHKLGRKVEKHEQHYEVPKQPGGGGGEIVNLTGMTPRQKEAAITEAHAKAGDTRITELGEKVELVE